MADDSAMRMFKGLSEAGKALRAVPLAICGDRC